MDSLNWCFGTGGGFLDKLFYFAEEDCQNLAKCLKEPWPLFLCLVVGEYIALGIKGQTPRLAESLNSLGHGILTETTKILTFGIQVSGYVWIHRRWRLLDLPWDSFLTWFLAFLAVDFGYYFAHRATHEINFLWAQHQVHHSSEDFNTSVSVRHPISHSWINSFFYLPLALVIPPPHCLAHQQLNIIYQAWIHTPLIGSLGPLEWVLNTPTHHRVHHGCNLYVLDKNFGGFLIIWDRLFGTFQEFRQDEDLIFGIVFQHRSFNPLWQTWHKFPGMWARVKSEKCWRDSLKVLLNGPSWVSGLNAPRLGRVEDKVDVHPRPKFEVLLPLWLNVYLSLHFLILAIVFHEFTLNQDVDRSSLSFILAFFVATVSVVGLLSEGNQLGVPLEILRCVLTTQFTPPPLQSLGPLLFIPSALIWVCVSLGDVRFRPSKTHVH